MNQPDENLPIFETLVEKYNINEIWTIAQTRGCPYGIQEFNRLWSHEPLTNDEEKNLFIDLFFTYGLKAIPPAADPIGFLDMVSKWYQTRNLESRNGHLSANEKVTLIHFCLTLRQRLGEFVTQVPLAEVASLSEQYHRLLIAFWRQLFFEPFSVLNLYWDANHRQPERLALYQQGGWTEFLTASMHDPFGADHYPMNAEELVTSSLPAPYKTILIYWMVNTPYFNADEGHRLKLMKYIPDLCQALIRHPAMMTTLFFLTFVQEVMTGLWRGSYIGGNNLPALAAFGDFISFTISRSFPAPKPRLVPKDQSQGEKIRIGYISRNFYKQAVSCYMVNRIVCHDPSKFEVYIFALGDYHDDVSDMFKDHSHSFERFENMTDFQLIIEKVREKELDMLIYTDIGMDPVTYILSGLQLAPVQCALVGHGTTTGMPTIQYYLSGDFEAPDAQLHYREKLITLPNLGAAQYLPVVPESNVTREELSIPEDGVVFISCANGIKHGHHRDKVLVEILKQTPQAWIILKPFANHSTIDSVFTGRITAAAEEAGVAHRLLILPPISQTKHVLGLLSIADVQLDTYPYGGWTTNMEALYMGLPIVTQEGSLARSRWGAGMLRALGTSEGIAANEEEYVAWAVRFAEDSDLRKKVKQQIQTRAQEVLFSGPAAQPPYEQTLIHLYQEELRRQAWEPAAILLPVVPSLTVATSLIPGQEQAQLRAVQSWLQAGFHVASVNALADIAALLPYFPQVEFIATPRDGRSQYGRPFIYFDDILAYFRHRPIPLCGIITPDLCLSDDRLPSFIKDHGPGSFLFGSRVDVDSPASEDGQVYQAGFDYCFFDRKMLPCYPPQAFCLDLPWWDYWAAIIPLMAKLPVKQITTPTTIHVKHRPWGSQANWLTLGEALGSHLRPPFSLTEETMDRFAEDTLTIITTLSQQVTL